MQYAITTQKLEKSFNGKEVIHASNMSVEYGTIYGLLGRNGAGKTTIFKILLGLLYPTCGKATVLGMDSVKDNLAILRKTVSATIVSSCIAVSIICQLIAQTIAMQAMEYPAITGIFTVILVIVILLHRNLCYRVKRMEV